MNSEKRILAARANGARSRGPITPEGKARFGPLDDVELAFVEEMVVANWRLRRAWTIETRMLDTEMDSRSSASEVDRLADSFGGLSSSPKLDVLLDLRCAETFATRTMSRFQAHLA
jgi:hypothetical protein